MSNFMSTKAEQKTNTKPPVIKIYCNLDKASDSDTLVPPQVVDEKVNGRLTNDGPLIKEL